MLELKKITKRTAVSASTLDGNYQCGIEISDIDPTTGDITSGSVTMQRVDPLATEVYQYIGTYTIREGTGIVIDLQPNTGITVADFTTKVDEALELVKTNIVEQE